MKTPARSIGFWCLLGVLVLLMTWRLSVTPDPEPAALLDASRVLLAEGTDYPFTADASGPVRIEVALSPHCRSEATVTLSPLRTALRPDPVYEPAVPPAHVFRVRAGSTPRTLHLGEAGAWMLRIEPIPMAMGAEGEPTRARVRIVPLATPVGAPRPGPDPRPVSPDTDRR